VRRPTIGATGAPDPEHPTLALSAMKANKGKTRAGGAANRLNTRRSYGSAVPRASPGAG
jgi:hypothetical protein